MSKALSFAELDEQRAELLPQRTVLSMLTGISGGRGGEGGLGGPGGVGRGGWRAAAPSRRTEADIYAGMALGSTRGWHWGWFGVEDR